MRFDHVDQLATTTVGITEPARHLSAAPRLKIPLAMGKLLSETGLQYFLEKMMA